MMDCEGDGGGLEELVDLATDIADSSPTIRDAAERLLTLLGVDEEDPEDLVSSSEDEGVELDELDEDDDEEDDDGPENARLLHQLAASLAMELKQSHQLKQSSSKHPRTGDSFDRDRRVELIGTSYLEHSYTVQQAGNTKGSSCCRGIVADKSSRTFGKQRTIVIEPRDRRCPDDRSRMSQDENEDEDEDEDEGNSVDEQVPVSWNAGWDACATEALRYLVEDEGLPPHHPTVLAMKDHLELQRERAFAQYTA
ncbi:uncharacterized protein LOC122536144 [Frieseomelitta varia]|uniref:uncharacterized protein LOC122536144 n=1 Tax=Frieseomelitta varia TaxID=561572 RepID=UPI001CB6977C|nr:uncharacterized protein LOC122536144 [Frieseomelitta varia]XP_043524213.1 uncharacterized protein LOC122536144 [Frieseomelitta varia]